MDRLRALKNSDTISMLSNTSVSSELGYETAEDDSVSSLYYSTIDDTLTPPNSSDRDEPTIVPGAFLFSPTNPNEDSSTAATTGTDSSMQISTDQVISAYNTSHQILSIGTGDIVENSIGTVLEASSIHQESRKNGLDANGLHSIATEQMSNLPLIPSLSSNNFAGSSTIVQELYVAAVSQQQTNKAPQLGKAARRATVRFQDNALPRRHELVRVTEVSPRRSVLPLSRRTQVVTHGPILRRTLVEGNTATKPESHICDVCQKSFPLRSTLNVHRNSHKTECKYCDRTFKKPLALSIHLKENCQKIPSAIRRKILTKEFKNISSRI